MGFNCYICFISWYSCRYYEFCSKIYAITAGTKKYKSIIKKKKKKTDKIVLLVKDKLNPIEVLISKALIDSFISHDEFVSVNNALREYYEMKQNNGKFTNFYGIHYIKTIKTYCFSCKKIYC